MHWIDQYTRATFQIYAGNTVDAFQPLDFFHFYPLWYDLWLDRIDDALQKTGAYEKTALELKPYLPGPSSLRSLIQKFIPSYRGFANKDPEKMLRVMEFIARMLQELCPEDPFGLASNPYHASVEQVAILKNIPWKPADPTAARSLGRFIASAGSFVHGIYNDLVTDFSWDTYGPYLVEVEGRQQTLLIRHFSDLAPADLWPVEWLGSIREVYLYGLYENVEWAISCVGCHTIVKRGNPITGLKQNGIVADGKALDLLSLDRLTEEFACKAESLYRHIRTFDDAALRQMVMMQECYQLKKLFGAVSMEWRPTTEMQQRVVGVPLASDLVPHGQLMTDLEVYKKSFGIAEFAGTVLGVAV